MKFLPFKKKDLSPSEIIHYVVVIQAPLNVVSRQLAAWYDNQWHPADMRLKFKCSDPAPLKVGAVCQASFKKVLNAVWQLRITAIDPNHQVKSDLTGFFNGSETVTVEERDNGIKVDYHMTYELKNPIHQIIWSLMMEDAFVNEIRKSMNALKDYCQKVKS